MISDISYKLKYIYDQNKDAVNYEKLIKYKRKKLEKKHYETGSRIKDYNISAISEHMWQK